MFSPVVSIKQLMCIAMSAMTVWSYRVLITLQLSLHHDYNLLKLSCSAPPSLALPRLLKAFQQLLQLCIGIFRVRLVTEEVDLVVHHATPFFLVRNVLQAVCLVPASRENVEGDLSANRVCEAKVGECFLELRDHGGSDVVLDVVGLVVIALLDRRVTADG
jgi:hypothetical protein